MVQERDAAMADKRHFAAQSRITDLPDKYLACDPLPDPTDEKDLTTFITLWKEGRDKTLQEAADNCQTAEDVVGALNALLSEALANGDAAKVSWCQGYIDEIRDIILQKYDEIS